MSLSDEELALLRSLAEPIAFGRRHEFLTAVAGELANCAEPGKGAVFRIARDVQRRYVVEARRDVAGETPLRCALGDR